MARRSHSKDGAPKGPTQRQLRVAEEIRHVLAALLVRGDIYHPDLQDAHVAVTEVRISPDLKNAKVYVMPMAGRNLEKVLKALNSLAQPLRFEVGRAMAIKYTPQLRFYGDETFDEAQRIHKLLRTEKVQQDLQSPEED